MNQNKFCKVHGCRYSWSHTTSGHECGTCHEFGHGQYECGDHQKINNLKNIKDILPLNLQCTMKGCRFKECHVAEIHKCTLCKKNHSSYDCPLSIEKNIQYIIECPICRTINNISENQPKVYGVTDNCCICTEKNVQLFFPNCGHTCICLDCADNLNKNKKEYEKEIVKENQLEDFVKQSALNKFINIEGKIYHTVKLGMGCSMWVRRKDLNSSLEGFFMHSDDWGQYGIDTDKRPLLNDFLKGYKELV